MSLVDRALRRIAAGERGADLELDCLDFKEDPAVAGKLSPSEARRKLERVLVDAAVCFANASGGTVVIGVADRVAGPAAFTGTAVDPDPLRRRVYELTVPPLLIDMREHYVDSVRLLVARVPQGVDVYGDTQGRSTWRVGTDCLPMSSAQIQRLRQDRTGFDPSALPGERTVGDVDPLAVDQCRRLLRDSHDMRRELADLSTDDLLSALGVVQDGRLLRAGEILLCRPENPSALYQYRPTSGGEPTAVERLHLPLVRTYSRVLELIEARRSMTPIVLPSGVHVEIEDFPGIAVQEALTNALVHRDYDRLSPVDIDHAPQTMTLTSPGPLVSGVTPQNILTTPSRPRNQKLMQAVRHLGLSEQTGRGVDRIYRAMIRSGRRPPEILSSFDDVQVVFVGGAPNLALTRFTAQLPDQLREDTDTLVTLLYLCNHPSVTAETLAPLLQKPRVAAQAVLERLSTGDRPLVEATRATARREHPTYRLREDCRAALGTALSYRARNSDEIDRRIIEHVREYGWITNRTIQNLFAVDVYQARRWLADLKARGVLIQTTEGRRSGPGITYGPGPDFPARRRRRKRSE